MLHFSECVSPGHPDKICDFISSYLLDEYMKVDSTTRYAVEVQMKDNQVTLAGEISSKAHFNDEEISAIVKKAIKEIGYTKDYQNKWGKDTDGKWNTICSDDVIVRTIISQQSSEIAQGVNNDGWGVQGIFFGMSAYNPQDENNWFGMLPPDFAIVKNLNYNLFNAAWSHKQNWGLDIKTGIVYDDKKKHIEKIIVAVPLIDNSEKAKVEEFVREQLNQFYLSNLLDNNQNYELIINGTGSYKKHATVADCGTTGRKLAVDFYGGNCKIGGGSCATKDGTKADVALNLYARKLSIKLAKNFKQDAYVSLGCCIGRPEVNVSIEIPNIKNSDVYDPMVIDYDKLFNSKDPLILKPQDVVKELKLDTPIYADMQNYGLFGFYQRDKEWEKDNFLTSVYGEPLEGEYL